MIERITSAIDTIKVHDKPLAIFVCGLGGSGKTTTSKKIAEHYGNRCIPFHTDWFLAETTDDRRKRIKETLDTGTEKEIKQAENPMDWYDWDKLIQGLRTLISDGELHIDNAWNQETGMKDLSVDLQLSQKERSIILCDGIYLLHPEIRKLADLIVVLRISTEEALRRAEERDNHRSPPEYLEYKATLLRKYDLPYFEKYMKEDDIVIDTNS